MNELKDISTLVFKNYPEINFIFWFVAIISGVFTSHFTNFLNILFQLAPEFLQNYLRHIHISSTMLDNLYIFMLTIFIFSFLLYFFGDSLRIFLASLFFKNISQESNMTAFFEKFILLLSTSLLALHILTIAINLSSPSNFFSFFYSLFEFGKKESLIALGKLCSYCIGFFASQLITVEEKQEKN